MWICRNCGENDFPKCNKCVSEDGYGVTDELAEQADYRRDQQREQDYDER